jgi:hypothetical protein
MSPGSEERSDPKTIRASRVPWLGVWLLIGALTCEAPYFLFVP